MAWTGSCWTSRGWTFFQPTLTRLDELRLTATEGRVEADLQLGRGAELVTELTALVAEHPLRERLVGALMRALSQAGRPAEALTVYERTRQTLADELGADPSPELSAVHTAVLRGQIGKPPAPTMEAVRRTNLRTPLTSFVGRDADVAAVSELVDELPAHHARRARRLRQDAAGRRGRRGRCWTSCRTVSGWWSSLRSLTAPRSRPQCWRRWIYGSRRLSVERRRRTHSTGSSPRCDLEALSWCSTTASTSSLPLRRWPTGCSRSARGCESSRPAGSRLASPARHSGRSIPSACRRRTSTAATCSATTRFGSWSIGPGRFDRVSW